MALSDDTNDSRTEAPTERRRRQAREQGTVARSTELLAAARILSIWIVLSWWLASFADLASSWLRAAFQHTSELPNTAALINSFREQSWRFVATASWPLLIVTSAILLGHFLQVGWLWHWNNLAPQANRLSPLSGLQKLLSSATAGRALGIVAKLSIVIGVSTMVLSNFALLVTSNSTNDFQDQFTTITASALQLVSQVTFAVLAFGALHYGWQRWRFERSLRMTREEVRDELKEIESRSLTKNQRHPVARQIPLTNTTDLNREANTIHKS